MAIQGRSYSPRGLGPRHPTIVGARPPVPKGIVVKTVRITPPRVHSKYLRPPAFFNTNTPAPNLVVKLARIKPPHTRSFYTQATVTTPATTFIASPIVVKLTRIRPPRVHSKYIAPPFVTNTNPPAPPLGVKLVRIRPPRTKINLRPPTVTTPATTFMASPISVHTTKVARVYFNLTLSSVGGPQVVNDPPLAPEMVIKLTRIKPPHTRSGYWPANTVLNVNPLAPEITVKLVRIRPPKTRAYIGHRPVGKITTFIAAPIKKVLVRILPPRVHTHLYPPATLNPAPPTPPTPVVTKPPYPSQFLDDGRNVDHFYGEQLWIHAGKKGRGSKQ